MAMIGKPIDRIDGRLKVTGAAKYAAEFRVLNLVHAVLVQSTIAAGTITGFDLKEAEEMPGVLTIITPDNVGKLSHPQNVPQAVAGPLLQNKDILYNGQHVAVVVASTLEQAQAAATRVRVTYANGEATTSMDTSLGQAYPPKKFRNGERPPDSNRGDPDGTFNSGAIKIDTTYITPIEHHNPMEPHATTAVWDEDRLDLYDATQAVVGHRHDVATVLGVDEDRVRVICPFVGGAFGCKGSMWMHSPLTAAAARALRRPVQTVLTREQMFTLVGHRPALIQQMTLAANPDGTLQAVKHEVLSTVSTSKEFIEAAAHRTSRFLYKSPNILVKQRLVPLDVSPPTFMRAPGNAPGMFALECAMDELAVRLNVDPVELRMRNYADVYPGRGVPWSSKNLADCYRIGAEKFGWAQRSPQPGAKGSGEWLFGMGMGTALYGAHRSRAAAKIRLCADGTAEVSSATQDLGTGTWTVLAMVGAEYLGLPVERVRGALGDSGLPAAPVSGGSQTVASVAPAIQKAAEAVTRKLAQMAATDPGSPFHGVPPEQLRYENGFLVAGNQRASFADVLSKLNRGAIEAEETTAAGSEEERYVFHSFGAQFCELKVNRYTAEVRVQRVTTVMDIGKVVNLKAARSQVIGGVVFGIGLALLEQSELETSSGRIANANLSEYLVATNADVPFIDVTFIDKPDLIFNGVGARGVGEIGITGLPAAIANAIYNATGKRIRDFPITPDKILMEGETRAPRVSLI